MQENHKPKKRKSMLLKKILSDTETNLLQRENSVVLCVEYNPASHCVEHVNYVHVLNGNFQFVTDITKIFLEQMGGDEVINRIEWREVANVEMIAEDN
jgi:hypothetical protein